MEFGEVSVEEAEGAILAHSVKHGRGVFRKGRLLSVEDLRMIAAAGIARIFAARLGPDDVAEDEAASAIARAAAGGGTAVQAPFTGRANLHATANGLAIIDETRVKALNRLHESVTLATVPNYAVVRERQMVATVKIIPFAVPSAILSKSISIIGAEPLVKVQAFRNLSAGLVITRLTQTKPSLIAKSEATMRERLAALGGELSHVIVCDHTVAAVSEAIKNLKAQGCHPVLVFGASAIVDRGDIIPAAVVKTGGEVIHLGMPVDPGNLMMLAQLQGVPVIGVPSCARSPKTNGFDWVLQRVMAGIPVAAEDIMDMGAGGLMAEIPTRPSPREGGTPQAPKVAAIVLAAGLSRRMGSNKLLAEFGGKPMIRRSAEAALAAGAAPVIVVTGNDAPKIEDALAGLAVRFAHNADYAKGLSGSLKSGIASLPADSNAVLVCLGDMPLLKGGTIERLIAAFDLRDQRSICVPVHKGRRGNPVLWGRRHFAAITRLEGDQGARMLMEENEQELVEVEVDDPGVLVDVDTPEELVHLQKKQ